jgi:hypothetical protein
MKSEVFLSGTNGSKGAHVSKSQMKKMLIAFSDVKGTVHFEFTLQGQTVNQAYYVQILKRLHEAVRYDRPELWLGDRILHHDNATDHKALSVKQAGFWPKKKNRLMKWDTHPIPLICLRITCGCFQK